MKVIHKPAVLPPLRPIHRTNEGSRHPIKDQQFFRRKPPKKRKKK